MAEKKSSGFKTFLLILITIAFAFVFSIAAYLILVPNSSVFGLKYASNTEKVTYEYTNEEKTQLLRLKDYSKIIINAQNGEGHTHVQINAGAVSGMTNSQVVLMQNTKGFMRTDAESKYTLSCVASGSTLTINVTEPQYNFLQIANNTTLAINLYTTSDNLVGTHFEINTGSGNVTLGGQIIPTESGKSLTFGSANITTKSGAITMNSVAQTSGAMNIKSDTGAITIHGNKTFTNLNLETSGGKILAEDLTANVNIKSFNSRVHLGNITGNVDFEMESGILEIGNISGKLKSENKILYTTVKVKEVHGAVTLINDEGNFAVDILKTYGDVAIRSGNKPIKIAEVYGKTDIETIGGSIEIKKMETNASDLYLKTKSGTILANYDLVRGNNTFLTQNGMVKFKFSTNAQFMLSASSENGRVYRTWLDDSTNPLENVEVGGGNAANNVIITSTSGHVRIEQVENKSV